MSGGHEEAVGPAGDGADPELTALRREVAEVDGRPVPERVSVFERVNDGLSRALARLDEV